MHTYTGICTHTHTHTYAHIHTHMHAYKHIYTHICADTDAHKNICTHIYQNFMAVHTQQKKATLQKNKSMFCTYTIKRIYAETEPTLVIHTLHTYTWAASPIHAYLHASSRRVCMYVYIPICIFKRSMYVCMHTYMRLQEEYVCMYAYLYAYSRRVCMYVCIPICVFKRSASQSINWVDLYGRVLQEKHI